MNASKGVKGEAEDWLNLRVGSVPRTSLGQDFKLIKQLVSMWSWVL